MKKKIMTMAAALMLAASASAQVFVLEDNGNQREDVDPGFNINNPDGFGQGTDYYTPVGSGTLLLVGLAGAYLVGKKKK